MGLPIAMKKTLRKSQVFFQEWAGPLQAPSLKVPHRPGFQTPQSCQGSLSDPGRIDGNLGACICFLVIEMWENSPNDLKGCKTKYS